ncbi:MAG TPA: serine/threonine-protein kinase [Terriglobales bacterium]|nr:serine/threonine-protein kinase [Terriglobales bacterium]
MTTPKDCSFGRYEILTELGRGAMGVVYKARDPKINRLVAIKTIAILGQSSAEEKEYRERFFIEAQAAGRLSHPCIVTIFDVGEELDSMTPYIVMEYVAGRSLEDLVPEETGRFPIGESLSLAQELAETLDYAHAHGIVHRDIKPANIILTEEGHPKIADFGIAKLNLANATSKGHGIGTPAYMSPEQLNGDPVDGRSDLFSLGAVLYTMLTGYRPFQGNSALTVSFKVVNREPVPVSALDSEVSPEVDYIIARAMAKDPAQRYQTGMEMALDLQDVRQGFLPRTTMSAPRPASNAGPSSLDTGGLSTVKFSLPLASQVKRRSAISPQRQRGWPLWQYVTIMVMAIGVLGIGFAMFRRPAPDERLGSARSEPAPVSAAIAPVVNRETAAAPVAAATPSTNIGNLPSENTGELVPARVSVKGSSQVHGKKVKTASHSGQTRPPARFVATTAASKNMAPQSAQPVQSAAEAGFSTLHMRVEHHFPEAQIFLWIDDKLSYTHSLGGTVKKRLVVFKGVQGFESESFRVSAGDHRVRVRVQSSDNAYDQTANIAGSFPEDGERALRIACGKHELKLALQ